MDVFRTVAATQAYADRQRLAGRRLALVPTMGALHEAHLALVREATRHADEVVVSIFVNPTQFAPGEDFERYPRTLQEDLAKLEGLDAVSAVFAPSDEEMYPDRTTLQANTLTWVTVDDLGAHLCGAHRDGHFQGVTTVVAKLFAICKPHVAVFGLKDAQQFLILRRMVRDLNFDVEMVGLPIVREPDGLAMSSRNVYLSEAHRVQAVVLSEAVAEAERLVQEGEQAAEALVEAMRRRLGQAPDAHVEYASVVDTTSLQPVQRLAPGQQVLAAVAVYFGETRLIDNAFIEVPATS